MSCNNSIPCSKIHDGPEKAVVPQEDKVEEPIKQVKIEEPTTKQEPVVVESKQIQIAVKENLAQVLPPSGDSAVCLNKIEKEVQVDPSEKLASQEEPVADFETDILNIMNSFGL